MFAVVADRCLATACLPQPPTFQVPPTSRPLPRKGPCSPESTLVDRPTHRVILMCLAHFTVPLSARIGRARACSTWAPTSGRISRRFKTPQPLNFWRSPAASTDTSPNWRSGTATATTSAPTHLLDRRASSSHSPPGPALLGCWILSRRGLLLNTHPLHLPPKNC
jgi:hypothetical protein